MKLIASRLWPRPAGIAAAAHNTRWHRGKAVAHIYVDRTTKPRRWVPEYEVRCPVCPAEETSEKRCTSCRFYEGSALKLGESEWGFCRSKHTAKMIPADFEFTPVYGCGHWQAAEKQGRLDLQEDL